MRASAVSAFLRREGFNPLGSGTSRMREGIRVSQSGQGSVYVGVDLDAPSAAQRLSDDVYEALSGRDGWSVERSEMLPTSMRVSAR